MFVTKKIKHHECCSDDVQMEGSANRLTCHDEVNKEVECQYKNIARQRYSIEAK